MYIQIFSLSHKSDGKLLQPLDGLKKIMHEREQFVSEMNLRLTAGGFDDMSYVTLLTPSTSLVMREDILRRTSAGKTNQSAVMKSSDWTARSAMTCARIRSENVFGELMDMHIVPAHTSACRP